MPAIRILSALMFSLLLASCQHSENPENKLMTSPETRFQLVSKLLNEDINGKLIEGSPVTKETDFGNAVYFDGDDRIEIDENSLLDADEFTIEIVFYPNDVYPNNTEPRFLHIESADKHNRVTIELRLNDKHEWYLDAYLRAKNDNLVLIDSNIVHPTEQWYHAAITYKDSTFTSFVNGKQELQGDIAYTPFRSDSRASIGARLNKAHWFNGGIHSYKITREALPPSEFENPIKLIE